MKLRWLPLFAICLALPIAACNRVPDEIVPPPQPSSPTKQTSSAKPAPKVEVDESLLYGAWLLHAVSAKDAKVPDGVTVEFQKDGTLVSRENSNLVSQGKFTLEGDSLTVVTPADEKSPEAREVASILKLNAVELELKQENDVVMRFKRTEPAMK